MGITGLLPLFREIQKPIRLTDFSGSVVAIDAYCWLHRGAYSCADKLARGQQTDQYVQFCMRMVSTVISAGLKPVMVLDGCRLPSKRETEKRRRESRQQNRQRAAELLQDGRTAEARKYLERSIDVTPEMAYALIKECRKQAIDYIVSPYEADAQLAYLSQTGYVDLVISEDSDTLPFGCKRVVFKLDQSGNGQLIDSADMYKVLQNGCSSFTMDKFRYMCILSGCDYADSLPGVGLGKAKKAFQRIGYVKDIRATIKNIAYGPGLPCSYHMNSRSLNVSADYVDSFVRANNTFLYQLVFDPVHRRLRPLNDIPDDLSDEDMSYAGLPLDDAVALQMAIGNVNMNTGKRIDFQFCIDQWIVEQFSSDSAGNKKKSTRIWASIWQVRESDVLPPNPSAVGEVLKLWYQSAQLPPLPPTPKLNPLSALRPDVDDVGVSMAQKRRSNVVVNEVVEEKRAKIQPDEKDDSKTSAISLLSSYLGLTSTSTSPTKTANGSPVRSSRYFSNANDDDATPKRTGDSVLDDCLKELGAATSTGVSLPVEGSPVKKQNPFKNPLKTPTPPTTTPTTRTSRGLGVFSASKAQPVPLRPTFSSQPSSASRLPNQFNQVVASRAQFWSSLSPKNTTSRSSSQRSSNSLSASEHEYAISDSDDDEVDNRVEAPLSSIYVVDPVDGGVGESSADSQKENSPRSTVRPAPIAAMSFKERCRTAGLNVTTPMPPVASKCLPTSSRGPSGLRNGRGAAVRRTTAKKTPSKAGTSRRRPIDLSAPRQTSLTEFFSRYNAPAKAALE